MISLNPADFELHLLFSHRTGLVTAFSLRPISPGHPVSFCQFLTENLYKNDIFIAHVLTANNILFFTASQLDMSLRIPLPTSFYIDIFRLLSLDIILDQKPHVIPPTQSRLFTTEDARRRPLGVCCDPVRSQLGSSVYVYDQTASAARRMCLSFRASLQ